MKKHINYFWIICFFLTVVSFNGNSQSSGLPSDFQQAVEKPRYLRIMFYNCENLFDIYDDSLTNDEEFLPKGDKYWSEKKYDEKLDHITKVITAIGGWNPPEIVGLCEIENRHVLNDLTRKTALYIDEYEIIHKESPDSRGIDVALLYQKKHFTPIEKEFIPITYPDSGSKSTRDILHVTGLTSDNDTLHVFVNHWPSRWGGQLESEDRRLYVASILRQHIDSLFTHSPNANIVIIGDFNDYPDNKSVLNELNAQPDFDSFRPNELYNLSHYLQFVKNQGSYKYDGFWGIIDQQIVSGSLLNQANAIYTTREDAHIFKAPFLLEPDDKFVGERPNRTYIGFTYHGGYSDHLPVFFDLNRK